MRVFIYYSERRSPGGGHKQMRVLARNLRLLGEASYLLMETGFDDHAFYQIAVPTADFGIAEAHRFMTEDDVLLLPEFRLDQILRKTEHIRCRKGVYAQGGFLALMYRPAGGYGRHEVEFMVAVSPYIAALGPTYLGLAQNRVFLVPYPVVRGPFAAPAPPFDVKREAVCCMPRKLPDHVSRARDIVLREYPDVPWIELHGATEGTVAEKLRESRIFLSTQNGEGFGLPAIEAMSTGCLVAGYPGTGWFPHPYATSENGLWAPDRSVSRAAHQICVAIALGRERGPRLAAILTAAHETATRFSEEVALTKLAAVMDAVRGRTYRGQQPRPRLGAKGHLQALRTLQWARRLRGDPAAPTGSQLSPPA